MRRRTFQSVGFGSFWTVIVGTNVLYPEGNMIDRQKELPKDGMMENG